MKRRAELHFFTLREREEVRVILCVAFPKRRAEPPWYVMSDTGVQEWCVGVLAVCTSILQRIVLFPGPRRVLDLWKTRELNAVQLV